MSDSSNQAKAKTLTIGGLETVYDALATAIDQAGAEKAQLFLVKLALLVAKYFMLQQLHLAADQL